MAASAVDREFFFPFFEGGGIEFFAYSRSEGCARTGYFIPVRDGMEAGEVWNFFRRRRRRRRPPKVGV